MTVYLPRDENIQAYWKLNKTTNTWDNIANTVTHHQNKTIITFDLAQGGPYDSDNDSNTITDPGGGGPLVLQGNSDSSGDDGSDSSGGGGSDSSGNSSPDAVPTLRIF